MAKLTLTYSDLYTRVSNFLGLTPNGTAPSSTDLTTCQDIVARGYRQFLYPIDSITGKIHEWQFLQKYYTFETTADQWKYALPVDFSDMDSHAIHYQTDELLPILEQRNKDQILDMRSDVDTKEWPQWYAIVPAQYDPVIGTTYELWFYPTPDRTYTFNFFYRFDPIKLNATTDLHVGGIRAVEAILESCLAVAETQEEDNTSTHHQQEAARLIQALILADTTTDTGRVGNLYWNREWQWPPIRPFLVPYKDENIYP
jgi:hypothetical protein